MQKAALGSDISNTASEEERKFNKILGIQGQAFIMSERERERERETEREKGLELVLKRQGKVENGKVMSTVGEVKIWLSVG